MYIIHLSPPLRTVKTLLRCTRAFKHRERKLYTVYFGIVHKEAPLREFPRYFTDSATQYDAALVSGAACYSKERNKTDFLSAGYVEGAAPCRRGNETVLF